MHALRLDVVRWLVIHLLVDGMPLTLGTLLLRRQNWRRLAVERVLLM